MATKNCRYCNGTNTARSGTTTNHGAFSVPGQGALMHPFKPGETLYSDQMVADEWSRLLTQGLVTLDP